MPEEGFHAQRLWGSRLRRNPEGVQGSYRAGVGVGSGTEAVAGRTADRSKLASGTRRRAAAASSSPTNTKMSTSVYGRVRVTLSGSSHDSLTTVGDSEAIFELPEKSRYLETSASPPDFANSIHQGRSSRKQASPRDPGSATSPRPA
jgi:hypothetical protein